MAGQALLGCTYLPTHSTFRVERQFIEPEVILPPVVTIVSVLEVLSLPRV